MGEAYFYHLTREPLEATLPILLERALAKGWRVTLRGTSRERVEWLDQKLWLGGEGGFLPHGVSGGPHDGDQPVLLTWGTELANDPACLMAVDGAEVQADEVAALSRVCILFDGNDDEAVKAARGHWRKLTSAGCAAKYWSEESGRWEKKAEA